MLKIFKKKNEKISKDPYCIETLIYEVESIAKDQEKQIKKMEKLNNQLKELIKK